MTDPSASWVPGWDASGFPADGLPYGVCDAGEGAFVGVAIGHHVLNLAQAIDAGLVPGADPAIGHAQTLNPLMKLSRDQHARLRARLQSLLHRSVSSAERSRVESCLVHQASIQLRLPVEVGDFTDFYASEHHALRSVRCFDQSASLARNWYAMPVSYCGRASAIVGDGAQIIRPWGQQRVAGETVYRPSRMLDFEAEIGLIIGAATHHGRATPVSAAPEHLFGISLLNDWSARDIQRWESHPLGPHLGKSFATQLGPWVLPLAALEGADWPSQAAHRAPRHLRHNGHFLYDVEVEATLASSLMRRDGLVPLTLSISNGRDLYWDAAQMIAHVTSNGAPLRVGDVLGTGTISGPALDQAACLLERTNDGRNPIPLPDGTVRGYLEDGDELILRGSLRRRDGARLSLGTLRATIRQAHDSPILETA